VDFEHQQLLAGMGMGKATNAKLQVMGQWPNKKKKKKKSQQWAEMSLGLKQYHKGLTWVITPQGQN
jgi:hypothetical protein